MCWVSAQEILNVAFRELIVSCSIFKEIDFYRVYLVVIVLDEDLESKDVKINMKQWINIIEKDSWIMKIMLVCIPPSSYPMLESRDEILV